MTIIPLITAVYLSLGIGNQTTQIKKNAPIAAAPTSSSINSITENSAELDEPSKDFKKLELEENGGLTNSSAKDDEELAVFNSKSTLKDSDLGLKKIANKAPLSKSKMPKETPNSIINNGKTAISMLAVSKQGKGEKKAKTVGIEPTVPKYLDSPTIPETAAKVLSSLATAKAVVKQTGRLQDSTVYQSGSIKRYKKTWVKEYEEYDCKLDISKPIHDFWLAAYFNQQQNENQGSTNITHGFNMQFMSGNLIKDDRIGIYGGLDWGMQFYGKTPNSNVALNTNRGDSGYTRLKNTATDFILKMQAEYNTSFIAPYVNAGFGPRLYYTSQKVKSYVPLKDVESTDIHYVQTKVSMMWNVGIGARVKISPRVSLDLRYDLTKGTKTKVVDLNATQYNGLKYNLVQKDYTPYYSQIRFGMVIDLSVADCKKTKERTGHWEVTDLDSTVIDNISDSTVIVLPCAECPCDKKSNRYQSYEDMYMDEEDRDELDERKKKKVRLIDILDSMDDMDSGSGNSGSGGKGGFPGIKIPDKIDH